MAKLISKTYGDALFDLALEENRLDKMTEEVAAVKSVLSENPELLKLLTHPQISKEEKFGVMGKIFGDQISPDMMGFLRIVIIKERCKEFDAIFNYFTAKAKEYKRIGVVSVTSATELSEAWKKKISDKLLATTSYKTLEIDYKVDKSLIGGLVIRIGDRVMDSSIKSKLELMKSSLSKVSVN